MNDRAGARPESISVVLVTCDEAHLLPACLERVSWADELVAVDMDSTDGSAEVARMAGARSIPHRRLPFVEPARAFAIDHATSDWILVLDPDERVMPGLHAELARLATAGTCDVVEIPFVQRAFGRDLLAPGARDGWHPRFFRRGTVRWPTEIHGFPDLSALRVHRIPDTAVLHGVGIINDTWPTVHTTLAKLARYVPAMAARLDQDGVRYSNRRLVRVTAREFSKRWVVGRGYDDGMPGFLNALMFSVLTMCIEAELWQVQGSSDRPERALRRLGRALRAPLTPALAIRRRRQR